MVGFIYLLFFSCLRVMHVCCEEKDKDRFQLMYSKTESEDDEAYTTALHQTRYLGIQGVSALSSFSILDPSPSSPHQDNILLALLIFSLPSPWTTPQSNTISLNLLSRHTTYLHNPEFIHHFLLTRILRPFFSASRPSTITSSGRKAMSSSAPPRHFETLSEEKARMPWRYEAPYAVPVLSWVIENIPVSLSFLRHMISK